MEMMISVILSYILTCLIEVIMLIILHEKNKKILLFSLVVNLITNVPLNIFINLYNFTSIFNYFVIVIGIELLIITIEWLLYTLVIKDCVKSIKYACILNLTSYLVGIVISLFIMIIS